LPFVILDCHAQEAVLRARITERERRGGDPSEADLIVLEHQLKTREPLNSGEQASAIVFDAERGNWHQTAHLLKTRFSHA
jgi:predicted kinase